MIVSTRFISSGFHLPSRLRIIVKILDEVSMHIFLLSQALLLS